MHKHQSYTVFVRYSYSWVNWSSIQYRVNKLAQGSTRQRRIHTLILLVKVRSSSHCATMWDWTASDTWCVCVAGGRDVWTSVVASTLSTTTRARQPGSVRTRTWWTTSRTTRCGDRTDSSTTSLTASSSPSRHPTPLTPWDLCQTHGVSQSTPNSPWHLQSLWLGSKVWAN